MGTGVFPGVKRPGRGVDHPLPSSAEDKERVQLAIPLLPLLPFVASSRVDFTFIFSVCTVLGNAARDSVFTLAVFCVLTILPQAPLLLRR
jgi:hypothetical protein